MKNISIITFINTIFIIAFVGLLSTFILFTNWEKQRYFTYEKQRYSLIADAFLSGLQFLPGEYQLQRLYKHFNVQNIKKQDQKLDILKYAKLLFIKNTIFGRVRVYTKRKNRFIYIQSLGYNLMLKDLKPKKYNREIALLLLALISGILTFIYTTLRRKLYPLKILDKEVQKFANGNLDVHMGKYGNDEIGKIATTFDKAIKAIKEQMESKNLFMRNMMHELKTPITKGRILAESIDDFEDKELLIRSFERMNEIITELAQVEKLTSKNITLNPQITSFDSIVEKAKTLLLCQEERIIKRYSNFRLTVDPDHFGIVLKNLIDNALKFSTDNKALVKATPKKIEILSKGQQMQHPLSYYTEPFSQEEKNHSGFGLGLYIVKSILNIHHKKFDYHYEDGYNVFEIVL